MKIKTSELIGAALDWAVAKCEGYQSAIEKHEYLVTDFPYSTDWAQGGPIGEREKIWVKYPYNEVGEIEAFHVRSGWPSSFSASGPTELVAKMRCYVASKLGDEIDVPDELV